MRDGTTLNDFMHWDNTLFDGITLNSEIDFETLVSSIMLKCGLRQPLYEEYGVFKSQVHIWFAAHEWNFDRLVRLINEKYNPLWNKDGVEERIIETTREESETGTRGEEFTRGGSNVTTDSGSDSRSNTLGGSDTVNGSENFGEGYIKTNDNHTFGETGMNRTADDKKYVTGFNASSEQLTDHELNTINEGTNDDRQENLDEHYERNGTNTDTQKTTYGRTENESGSHDKTINEAFGENHEINEDTKRDLEGNSRTVDKFITQGNIGVTTSQAMFKEELDLLGGFNLYDFIANKFDDDLMIGVFC